MPPAKNPDGACTSVPTRSACGRHGSPVALERALETTIPAEVYDGLEARMGE